MKTVTYHGPPVAGLGRMTDDEEPEPRQTGKIYPVSEEAMANLRRVLASQSPKPKSRGYRQRAQNNLVQNLLRRQRELQEAGRLPVKKKGGGVTR